MKVTELYNKLSELIPPSLSCSWDRDGFEACPEPEREVRRVLIALDITNEVIDKAIGDGADVIISHHPLFFGGLGNINALTFDGARAVKLAKHGIAAMSFHTRLDALDGGVNDILAEKVGLKGVMAVGEEGIVRVGELDEEMTPSGFALYIKKILSSGEGARAAHITLCPAGRNVKKVALIGGSGGDDIAVAAAAGADTFLTGELKYHHMLSGTDFGMNLVCAGHFFTEYPVCAFLEASVKDICPEAQTEMVFSNRIIEF